MPYFPPFGAPRPRPHGPHLVVLLHGGRPPQAGSRTDGSPRRAIHPGPPRVRSVPPAAQEDPDPARGLAEGDRDGAPERPRLQRLLLSRDEDGPVGNRGAHHRAEPRLHGGPGAGRPRRALRPAARLGTPPRSPISLAFPNLKLAANSSTISASIALVDGKCTNKNKKTSNGFII